MPIIWQNADIDKAVAGIVEEAKGKAQIILSQP